MQFSLPDLRKLKIFAGIFFTRFNIISRKLFIQIVVLIIDTEKTCLFKFLRLILTLLFILKYLICFTRFLSSYKYHVAIANLLSRKIIIFKELSLYCIFSKDLILYIEKKR